MTRPSNDLGGRVYSEGMQEVLYQLTTLLKQRDTNHSSAKGLVPSQYMKYYVKSAGVIAELAMALASSAPNGEETKNFLSWIKTLTGFTITTTEGLFLKPPVGENHPKIEQIKGVDYDE